MALTPGIADETMARKVGFIICDQLRYDYLGCTGHPSIRTPNIDKLAKRGVNCQLNLSVPGVWPVAHECLYGALYVL